MAAAASSRVNGGRNAALVAVLYRAGARLSEALGIDWPRDVRPCADGGGMYLRLRAVKGAARGAPPREIGLDPKAADLVRSWIATRAPMGAGPLFCTASGARMLPSYVRALLPRLARRAGITQRVHAHGLRHTFAREYYEETGDLVKTSRALGHANVATTDIYLRSIGVTQAAETNMRRVW